MTETAIAETNGAALAPVSDDWGYDADVSEKDFQVPKLLIMQNTSKLVADKEVAKAGEIVSSTTESVIAEKDTEVEFVPLTATRTWVNYDISGSQPKFVGIDPVTPQNEDDPWEFEVDGVPHRRDYTLNFFVLLRSDLGTDDAFPYALSFSRTSLKAGKALASHFILARKLRTPACRQAFFLSTEKKTSESNAWYIGHIKKGDKIADEELAHCREWWNVVRGDNVKVDHSDLVEHVEETPQGDAPKREF